LRKFGCANEEEEVKSMMNWLSGKTEWLSGKTDKEIKERRKHGV
jgi:protoheme ferro-lyase